MAPTLKKRTSPSLGASAFFGAAAGLIATIPMTVAMNAVHRRLPRSQQYALPPEQIVDDLTEAAGMEAELTPREHDRMTNVAHYAYGAAGGAAYGILVGAAPVPRLAKGAGFGLGLWGAGYLGWLPALDFRAAATKQPAERNAMMIAAHLVWGVAAATAFDAICQSAPIRPK